MIVVVEFDVKASTLSDAKSEVTQMMDNYYKHYCETSKVDDFTIIGGRLRK